MAENWINSTIKEVKVIPSTEIKDYQIVFIEEWGDYAFYHPNYIPVYADYDNYTVDRITYNILESFLITPPNKTYDSPGRWVKMGDINLTFISPENKINQSGFQLINGYPKIIPYKIGQKCNILFRDYPYRYNDNDDDNYKGYPVDIVLTWETIKIPTNITDINPDMPIDNYTLSWWMTYTKPVICMLNPKRVIEHSFLNGLLWYKWDENELYISDENQWSTINLSN